MASILPFKQESSWHALFVEGIYKVLTEMHEECIGAADEAIGSEDPTKAESYIALSGKFRAVQEAITDAIAFTSTARRALASLQDPDIDIGGESVNEPDPWAPNLETQ